MSTDTSPPKQFFVYLLFSSSGNTYVGATVNLDRRLRQHNKVITGGAKLTAIRVEQGDTWERAAHVSCFPDWQAALQFEWRWKQISRKIFSKKDSPLLRRLKALQQLLSLEQSTSKALPFSQWSTPPVVHIEHPDASSLCSSHNLYFPGQVLHSSPSAEDGETSS